MNIIGLGQAGCAIAEKFKQHSQYTVYKIDVGLEGENCFALEKQDSPEKYEKSYPKLKAFIKEIKNEVLYITSAGMVSGASLHILEQLHKKSCKINILYIKPDRFHLSETKKLQDNVVYSVLQEYARSGLFNNVLIVDNLMIENILEEVTIKEYYDKINTLIVSTIHMINVFNNTQAILDTSDDISPSARISTLGLVDIDSGEEKLFFDIKNWRYKKYYYAIPEETLNSDGSLLKKIKKQIKNKAKDVDERIRFTYGVYSTSYEQTYGYVIVKSSAVQKK